MLVFESCADINYSRNQKERTPGTHSEVPVTSDLLLDNRGANKEIRNRWRKSG